MRKQRLQIPLYDRWILATSIILVAFGLLMVASASMVISDRQYGYPLHYFLRQLVFLSIGVVIAWGVTRVPMAVWSRFSLYLFGLALLLLVVVLIPGIGRLVNGSRRWINLGVIALQVSEVAKFATVIYIASYLERFKNQVQFELKGFLKPMLLLGIVAFLLLLEPDFGAATVITATVLILLFIAGVRLWPFIALFVLVLLAFSLLAVLSPYRLARLTTFLNPWGNAFGSGYQLTQSLIAFGRGGFWGVGLGNSIQKLFYLPEAHTDFIFAVIAEELGLIGETFLIALYAFLAARMLWLGRRAQLMGQLFSSYTAYGLATWLSLQALINVGVNTGLLPTKGLTLPFISYGGSSLIVNCVVIGIVMRISYEVRLKGAA